MFIKNQANEVVNVEHILYIRAFKDRAPYEIHVVTDKSQINFNFNNELELAKAKQKILFEARRAYPRWIEIETHGHYIRADKVKSVVKWQNAIKVVMEEEEFLIYPNVGHTADEILQQVCDSLSEHIYDEEALVEI